MGNASLSTLLLIWMVTVGTLIVARAHRGGRDVGLVLSYLLNLWMIHWVAPALYLLPAYDGVDTSVLTAGVEQSLYAVVAFAFGSAILAPFVIGLGVLPTTTRRAASAGHLPVAYMTLGMISYVLLSVGAGAIPSAGALLSTGQQLVVAGLALCCWQAMRDGDVRKLTGWLAVTCLLPFITVLTQGFLGYGAVAALSVFIFVSRFIRKPLAVTLATLLVGYVALSVYVTYMRDRSEIRATVWGGQSFENRLAQLQATVAEFEWFDLGRPEHRLAIDNRLNQSALVGLAVARMGYSGEYAQGETLWEALIALVPRALWPDKPVQAGSGNLVSRFTGVQFAPGTSVGIGQVMEFYVNFGTLAVLLGFAALGVILTILDSLAAEHLAAGDLRSFLLWFLPGLAMVQPGGSLVEMAASAAASVVAAIVANALVDGLRRRSTIPQPVLSGSVVRLRQ